MRLANQIRACQVDKDFPDFEYQRVSKQALGGSLANRLRPMATIFDKTDQEQDGQVSVGLFAQVNHMYLLFG